MVQLEKSAESEILSRAATYYDNTPGEVRVVSFGEPEPHRGGRWFDVIVRYACHMEPRTPRCPNAPHEHSACFGVNAADQSAIEVWAD